MGLITKKVKVRWHVNNRKHYEKIGYVFTKYGDEFFVDSSHLLKGSNIVIECKCDNCGKIFECTYMDYNRRKKEDNKIFCLKCGKEFYDAARFKQPILLKFISFEEWCIKHHREDILNRWDYDKNLCAPKDVSYKSVKSFWFKCDKRSYHHSELNILLTITRCDYNKPLKCIQCNSIAQYIIDKYGDLNKVWSDKNGDLDPWTINKGSKRKVWLKCTKTDYHYDYKTRSMNFTNGNGCPYCARVKVHQKDSFGQYIIEQFPDKSLYDIWDIDKNEDLDPMTLAKCSNKKVWIKCQEKDYHVPYLISCDNFIDGCRCPYCAGMKIHPKDSFGQYLIDEYGDLNKIWSDKNGDLDPMTLAKHSKKKVWIKCQKKDYHYPYLISCDRFIDGGRCPYCVCRKVHPKDSLGQYIIEQFPGKSLYDIWDIDKNGDLDPWSISKRTNTRIWIKCQKKDYHGSYSILTSNFTEGSRCPYCYGRKVHPKDSLGQYVIDNYGEEFLWKIWDSDKNDKSPFEFTPYSNKKVWFKCPDRIHESFKRLCAVSTTQEYRCPKCSKDRKESYIEEKTRLYLEELGYEVKTELECSIVPKNPKTKYYLPFDNEIILENGVHLIIEVHGAQHYEYKSYKSLSNVSEEQAKQGFHYRQLKDRYKRMFCKKCGYEYLELSYKCFRNDKYKEIIDNKINRILNKTQTHIDTDIWFECLMIDNVAERMRKLSTQKNTK